MTIKGFLTNLGKYTEGKLVGKWVTFPLSQEELQMHLESIGVDGIQYEEYFFTDWETEFENDFGEYESLDRINELAEQLIEWDADKFKAACEVWSIREVLERGEHNYILYDDVKDEYDLGYYWIVESGCYDVSNIYDLDNYFDYEGFARDLEIERYNPYDFCGCHDEDCKDCQKAIEEEEKGIDYLAVARELFDEGCVSDEQKLMYFNYASFGHDVAIESNGGFTEYGYIEYIG